MQLKMHMVTIEDLVPKGHFLRKLESALDLSFVYEETAKLYSHRYGRPPYDPVVMVKYLLVGYLYGIPSERQIEQRIQTDMALRWYLGLDVFDRVPDHSTISQLRRRKPSFRKVFRRLFEKVVEQCIQKGLVSGRLVATDSTHVKANASRTSEHLVDAMEKPGVYWERLDQFEEEGLEELEKKVSPGKTGRKRRQKRTKPVRGSHRYDKKWVSRTDPESGHLNRPGKPQGPHYLAHQTVDCDHGIILDTVVTSGEVNDAVPYLKQIEHIHREILPIQAATADSAYDLPLFHRVLKDHNIRFYVRPCSNSLKACGKGTPSSFAYDEENDLYRCPQGKELELRNLTRLSGGLRWVYYSKKTDCDICPVRTECIGKCRTKHIERNYFWKEIRADIDELETPLYQRALRKRSDLERRNICSAKMGEQFGQAFPARNRGSGRPLPPFRNRIKLKKDDTSLPLTPTGVFFLALSHSIRHNLFPGHSLSTGRILRWRKQRKSFSQQFL